MIGNPERSARTASLSRTVLFMFRCKLNDHDQMPIPRRVELYMLFAVARLGEDAYKRDHPAEVETQGRRKV